MRRATVRLLILAVTQAGAAQPAPAATTRLVAEAEWILSRQVATGPDAGLIEANAGQSYTVPYFSNIAASGLASASSVTGDMRYVAAAWRWLWWYARHMDASGFITNYYWTGSSWASTGNADSTDSYAATFLIALRDAYAVDGDDAALTGLWPFARKAVAAMLATDNGRWLTYAKPTYRHAFLMDNVEVYEAFRAVEELAATPVVDDPATQTVASSWTANMPQALDELWNGSAYDIAVGSRGERYVADWRSFYPTATAQAWMLRTGLVPAARAQVLVDRIETTFPWWDQSGLYGNGMWWPEPIEALRVAGRASRAAEAAARMAAAVEARGRAWPYHVGNAGTLIEQLAARPETLRLDSTSVFTAPGATTVRFAAASSAAAAAPPVTFECALDDAAYVACASPHTVATPSEGRHTLRIRAREGAVVDASPVVVTWFADATGPETTILSAPAEPGNATPVFTLRGSDAQAPEQMLRFECAVDGAAFAPCASGAPLQITGTATHHVRIRAVDPAGNVGAEQTHSWFADATRPETSAASGPAGVVTSGDARFEFDGTDDGGAVRFECRIGTAAFSPCTSPHDVTVGEGMWRFEARAVDGAGNPDLTPAAWSWTVDRSPPATILLDRPPSSSRTTAARFTFSGADNVSGALSFECSVDGAPMTRCRSPYDVASLAEGQHVFEVRAVDASGYRDASPARHEWTVDTGLPRGAFTTPDGTVLADAPTLSRRIAGIAGDDLTGVSEVVLRLEPLDPRADAEFVAATLECSQQGRTACSWRADVRIPRGRYRVTGVVADRAGNESPLTPSSIAVTVL